ncbi:MAG: hypothetical protein DI632_08750 [Sphingomonas hengshuiensis]|uniref:Uncharacterized protein n=1 Tax=Sphingomonas hengshuiensis TaxID=1609977 RepID=A0A2W4Z5I2_9SPHN|nr:MAG: hypothetical protein DI632_08750 [Sphingomonas hengshuiensis]
MPPWPAASPDLSGFTARRSVACGTSLARTATPGVSTESPPASIARGCAHPASSGGGGTTDVQGAAAACSRSRASVMDMGRPFRRVIATSVSRRARWRQHHGPRASCRRSLDQDAGNPVARSRGEGKDRLVSATVAAPCSRAIGPCFDLRAGIRPAPTRAHAAVGAEGLAPAGSRSMPSSRPMANRRRGSRAIAISGSSGGR